MARTAWRDTKGRPAGRPFSCTVKLTTPMAALAAYTHVALTAVVVAFQLALAAGAPWGRLAMGGRYPGRLPTRLRVAAVAQAALLAGLSALVLSRSDLALPGLQEMSSVGAWVATGVGAASLALNLASPSAAERRLWAPVAALLTTSAAVVALS